MTENGCQTIIYRPALHCSLLIHHLKTNSAFADGFFVCEGAVSRGSTSLCSPAEDNGSRRVGISPPPAPECILPCRGQKGFQPGKHGFRHALHALFSLLPGISGDTSFLLRNTSLFYAFWAKGFLISQSSAAVPGICCALPAAFPEARRSSGEGRSGSLRKYHGSKRK